MMSLPLGIRLTLHAIRRQLAAMPNDLYLVRLIHNATGRPVPGERLWTASQLLSPPTVRFLRIRNREGCDVYLLPYADDRNASYFLLDLDRAEHDVLHRMRTHGHHPCLVLQTSPGHLQAWLHLSTAPLLPHTATALARRLAQAYGGDPASADWRHLGRLAGFTNQKPARRSLSGFPPWVKIIHACPGLAPNANALLASAIQLPQPLPPLPQTHSHQDSPAITAAAASSLYRSCVCQWNIPQRFSPPDWSIVDLWIARHLLSLGLSPLTVQDIIRLGSPDFPRRHGNPEDYLRRTLQRAAFPFPPRGDPVC